MHEVDLDSEAGLTGGAASADDDEFDTYMGALEDVIMDEEFARLQQDFCERHCDAFEPAEENRLEYTQLHAEYAAVVERRLESMLAARVQGFDLRRFGALLGTRGDDVGEDLRSLLLSFEDFAEFKAMMLDHKRAKHAEGKSELCIVGKSIA